MPPNRRTSRLGPSRAALPALRRPAGYGYPRGAYVGPSGLMRPSDIAMLTGSPYPDGPLPATEREAMGLPPFGRGCALLANAVAGTDWQAVRWDAAAGVSTPRPDQPAVLSAPDPNTTAWHYRWAATMDLILFGNHFGLAGPTDPTTRRPKWVWPVHADRVGLLVDPENGVYTWVIDGQEYLPYAPDPGDPATDPGVLPDYTGQVFHVSAGNRSGEVLGLGVLGQYAEWLGGVVAAESHAGAYFAGGALPPAILQSPTVLTQPQADDLKAKWRQMVTTREPVVFPQGYVLTPIVSDADKAQMVESRQWNAAAVAMILGIPSYKLGLAGPSMTYQNIESADIEFVRDSVDRYAQPLSRTFSDYLMPRGTSVAWQYAGRMRADQKTTADVLTTYTGAGIFTVDEARAAIGRPPLEEPEPPAPPEVEPDDDAEPAPDAITDSPESVAPTGR